MFKTKSVLRKMKIIFLFFLIYFSFSTYSNAQVVNAPCYLDLKIFILNDKKDLLSFFDKTIQYKKLNEVIKFNEYKGDINLIHVINYGDKNDTIIFEKLKSNIYKANLVSSKGTVFINVLNKKIIIPQFVITRLYNLTELNVYIDTAEVEDRTKHFISLLRYKHSLNPRYNFVEKRNKTVQIWNSKYLQDNTIAVAFELNICPYWLDTKGATTVYKNANPFFERILNSTYIFPDTPPFL